VKSKPVVIETRGNWNAVAANFEDRVCNSCGNDKSEQLLAMHGTAYHRCLECSLIYARPMAKNLTDINEQNYQEGLDKYAEKAEKQRIQNHKRLRIFDKYRKTNLFLEIGCNTGIVILAARDLKWDVKGVDISIAASEYAREKRGLDVFSGDVMSAKYPSDSFDVIYTNSVMEHLDNPKETLIEVKRILRPGGVFYADTVNWDSYTRRILGKNWRYMDPIDHVHLYTPENVLTLAENVGLEHERTWTTGVRVRANQPGSSWDTPWYFNIMKGPLSLATRFTNKGDAIKFLLRKPI
jgi:SAM-dependent methyltransferase